MRKFIILFLFILVITPVGFAANTKTTAQTAAPLLVGGNFSTQSNNPTQTRAFTQDARDGEVARLREQLRNGQYNEVIKRINTLTANNFVDNRFYLLLAIAFDGLKKIR